MTILFHSVYKFNQEKRIEKKFLHFSFPSLTPCNSTVAVNSKSVEDKTQCEKRNKTLIDTLAAAVATTTAKWIAADKTT
jgi:hypothetical protein